MLDFGLGSLFSKEKVRDFFFQAWPGKPYVMHGKRLDLQPLLTMPQLQSLDLLLGHWTKSVQVHLPDVSDESSSIDTSSFEARKLFKNKMALLFNNADIVFPDLKSALLNIQKDLGLPASTLARCMLYATPDGKGTAAHFDQNINFVVQIYGTKIWKLAENTCVKNPTERFTIGQPIDRELATYIDHEMPSAMPESTLEIELQPGSVLFVPRGFWHSTKASGDALALNFTYSQPTWLDVFLLALKSRLILSPEWRELADGVSSSDTIKRDLATQRLDCLLVDVIDDLPNWKAKEILQSTEGL